jgi:hypothetical protein
MSEIELINRIVQCRIIQESVFSHVSKYAAHILSLIMLHYTIMLISSIVAVGLGPGGLPELEGLVMPFLPEYDNYEWQGRTRISRRLYSLVKSSRWIRKCPVNYKVKPSYGVSNHHQKSCE